MSRIGQPPKSLADRLAERKEKVEKEEEAKQKGIPQPPNELPGKKSYEAWKAKPHRIKPTPLPDVLEVNQPSLEPINADEVFLNLGGKKITNKDNKIRKTNTSLFSKETLSDPIKFIRDSTWWKLQTGKGKLSEVGGALAGGGAGFFLGAGAAAPILGPFGALGAGAAGLALGAFGGRKAGFKLAEKLGVGNSDETKIKQAAANILKGENNYSLQDLDTLLKKKSIHKEAAIGAGLYADLKKGLAEGRSDIRHLQLAKRLLGSGLGGKETLGDPFTDQLIQQFGMKGYKTLLDAKAIAPKNAKEGIDQMLQNAENSFQNKSLGLVDPTQSKYHPYALAAHVNDVDVLRRLAAKDTNIATSSSYLAEQPKLLMRLAKEMQAKGGNEQSAKLLNEILKPVSTEEGAKKLDSRVQSELLALGRSEQVKPKDIQTVIGFLQTTDKHVQEKVVRWLKAGGRVAFEILVENPELKRQIQVGAAAVGAVVGTAVGGPVGAVVGSVAGGMVTDVSARIIEGVGKQIGVKKSATKAEIKKEDVGDVEPGKKEV